jgi:hypothetical protein
LLRKLSVADAISISRRRFPGALVCTTCARLIASTPAGYANSSLTSEQVEKYTCAECRMEPARAANETARLRALPPKVHLKEPIVAARAYAPPQRRDEPDAAYRRRVERWEADRAASHALLGIATPSHPYFGRCSLRTDESPAPSADAEQSRAGKSASTKARIGPDFEIGRTPAYGASSACLAGATGGPRSDQRGSHEAARSRRWNIVSRTLQSRGRRWTHLPEVWNLTLIRSALV